MTGKERTVIKKIRLCEKECLDNSQSRPNIFFMKKIKDITNQIFGRLTVIRLLDERSYGHTVWECQCECGKLTTVYRGHLISGATKSCGCLRNEMSKKRLSKHNMEGIRFYRIWHNIKTRCLNPKYNCYHRYGGRGITVCDKWLDFINFRDDMYNSYLEHVKKFGIKQTSIDRINNDGNYELSNCRWATIIEQSMNKSV